MQNTAPEKSWKQVHLAISLVTTTLDSEWATLLGPKLTGVMNGIWAPVGGHVEEGEEVFAACARELREESGYLIDPDRLRIVGRKAAKLVVSVESTSKIFMVDVIEVALSELKGELVHDDVEFEWLKFIPLSQIPWEKLAPRDEDWMRCVIAGTFCELHVECGENRLDVKKSRLIVHEPQTV